MTKRTVWEKRIDAWEHSGQSQRVFCAKRGLALSTFQWWRAKLRQGKVASSSAPFLPLALATAPSGGASIEVELRSKTRLRLEGEAALRSLDSLLAKIR
jgi:hypothetical protein